MYKGLGVYNVNSELTCSDLVSNQNFQHGDELSLFDKAVPTLHVQFISLLSSSKVDKGKLEEDEGELEENEAVLEDY